MAHLGLEPTDARSNDAHNRFVLTLIDSGLRGGEGDFWATSGGEPEECATAVPGIILEISQGNILVHDAQP